MPQDFFKILAGDMQEGIADAIVKNKTQALKKQMKRFGTVEMTP